MAVIWETDEWHEAHGGFEGRPCFLCIEPVDEFPYVLWSGATGEISFHPGCAASFVFRLGCDIWRLEKGITIGGDQVAPRRDLALLTMGQAAAVEMLT